MKFRGLVNFMLFLNNWGDCVDVTAWTSRNTNLTPVLKVFVVKEQVLPKIILET